MKNKLQSVKWMEVFLCILTFMAARVGIANYYTVGISFLGGLSITKDGRRWAGLFCILGIISHTSNFFQISKYILVIAILECIYSFSKRSNRNESYQMLCVGGAIIAGSIGSGFIKGITLYHIFNTCIEGVVGGGLTFLFKSGLTVIETKRKTPLTQKEAFSMALLCSIFLAGWVDFFIKFPFVQEVYFKDIATFVVLIGITYLAGIHIALTLSIVLSSILVLIGYMPQHFVLAYSLCIIAQGIFMPVGRKQGVIGGALGLVLGFLLFNTRVLDFQIIGAYGIAGIISVFLPKNYFGINTWFGYEMRAEKDEEHLLRVQKVMSDRVKEFIHIFSNLAKGFEKMNFISSVLGVKEKEDLIEDVGVKLCMNCSMQKFCWKQDVKKTYRLIYQMIDEIGSKGEIALRDIPEDFRKNCIQAENFAYMLQLRLELYKQEVLWKNKMIEHEVLVGKQLETIVNMMENSIRQVEGKVCFNKEEENFIKEDLLAKGIKVKDLMIIEKNNRVEEIRIQTQSCYKNDLYTQKILKSIKENLQLKVNVAIHKCEENGCSYILKPAKTYHITCGASVVAKENVSGDVYSFQELKDGQYLLALADGMGSGKEAKDESTATIEMLEDFMEAGFNEMLAIELINASLILKNDKESFSTIDLTLIDCYSGVARFIKAGAATSFLLRDGKVSLVRSSSFPIGMLREVDIHTEQIELKHGDLLIMVTDGMLATKEDVLGKENTFKHFITQVMDGDPQYIADSLMEKSKHLLGNEERDDMTIIVAKVWQKY